MDSPSTRPAEAGLFHQAGVRVLVWWPVKLIGTTGGMAAFFAGYFWVLRHPRHPVTLMPLTALDRLVGPGPETLPLYLSLWLYVSLGPALVISRRELVSYGVAAAGLGLTGLGIFFLWPTAVPTPAMDGARHPLLAWLQSADASGNACPSLHVAFAVFTASWLGRMLREMGAGRAARALNRLWCAGIVYSTVATGQHVVLDVLAGAGLGAAGVLMHWRWRGAVSDPSGHWPNASGTRFLRDRHDGG